MVTKCNHEWDNISTHDTTEVVENQAFLVTWEDWVCKHCLKVERRILGRRKP